MLGVAGILAQEIVKPGVFFYNAGLPENLPNINFGGPDGKVTLPALQSITGLSRQKSSQISIVGHGASATSHMTSDMEPIPSSAPDLRARGMQAG